MVEVTSCPVCKSTKFKAYMECEDYTVSHEKFKIQACEACGFLFTNPRPKDEDLGRYYKSEDYISHSDSSAGLVNKLYKLARNFTLKRKYDLVKPYANKSRLLDVGCGTGAFLNYCAQQGLKVEGVEPDPDARAFTLKNYQLTTFEEKQLKNWPKGHFSAITMWHVLEHVPYLNERIEELKALLADEGRVFVAVPNYWSGDAQRYGKYWAAYDVPRHLWHFSPQSIEQLFLNHGMKLEKTLPMKLDSYYVSLLSEKYKNGSSRLVPAFLSGLSSNLKAGKQKWSSQIYVFSK